MPNLSDYAWFYYVNALLPAWTPLAVALTCCVLAAAFVCTKPRRDQ